MKTHLLAASTAMLAIGIIAVVESATAEEELVKSATLSMTSWKVAFIGSAGQSKGTLDYQGKTRKFKMTGLGIGGIGISTSSATGIVYNMKTMDDFTGSYTSARSGITLGDSEFIKDRMLWLQNEKGVKIKLTTDKAGLELNLGADGSVVVWDD
jgi:hypothetical protein